MAMPIPTTAMPTSSTAAARTDQTFAATNFVFMMCCSFSLVTVPDGPLRSRTGHHRPPDSGFVGLGVALTTGSQQHRGIAGTAPHA